MVDYPGFGSSEAAVERTGMYYSGLDNQLLGSALQLYTEQLQNKKMDENNDK